MEATKRVVTHYAWKWAKNVLLENAREIPYYLSNRDFEDTLGNFRRSDVRESTIRDIERNNKSKVIGHAVQFWIERTTHIEYDDEKETRITRVEKLHRTLHHYEGRYLFTDEELEKHCKDNCQSVLDEVKAEDNQAKQ